jgi:replicative DNA helicase
VSDPISREPISGAEGDLAQPRFLADLIDELVTDAEEVVAAAAEGRPLGPMTGIPTLDHALGHCLEPGIHSITGDPGTGKTALGLQAAARCRFPAIFISTEQSAKVLLRRHISRETQTDRRAVKQATPPRIRELAVRAATAAPQLLLLDATRRPAPKHQVIALGKALGDRFGTTQVLVVLDALQPWAKGLREGVEYDAIQAAVADMVSIASELKSPVIALSHRNRLAARDKNATGLVAAKGSADIEHMAETALHLATDGKEYDPASEQPRDITCHISKNRHGPSGFYLSLYYYGRTDTFSDKPHGSQW